MQLLVRSCSKNKFIAKSLNNPAWYIGPQRKWMHSIWKASQQMRMMWF